MPNLHKKHKVHFPKKKLKLDGGCRHAADLGRDYRSGPRETTAMFLIHIQTLAKEIGVHRNTIRNWVKSGRIIARPGPGKGLVFTPENFQALCREFQLRPEQLQTRELSRQPADSLMTLGQNPLATREEKVSDKIIGSVMVVGGGIAGIQASLDLADQGYYVYLVEKSAGIGGKMSQLDKTYPTNDCAM